MVCLMDVNMNSISEKLFTYEKGYSNFKYKIDFGSTRVTILKFC